MAEKRPPKLQSGSYALRLGVGRETRKLLPPLEPALPQEVTLVVVRLGPHRVALEAARVIEIRAGAVYMGEEHERRPIIRIDLHELLQVPSSESCQTLVARADGRLGRGDGPRVAFAVDDCDRLVVTPLEAFAPLPPIAREQIQIDFLVGVVKVLLGGEDATAFLLDPERLARARSADRG